MPYHFLFSIILLLTGLLNNLESEWKLELDKEGILVYTRHADGSDFKEFKSEMVIDGTVSEIADIITDVEKYPEWCYKTESTRIIKKEGNIVQYFHVTETPGFLKTRVGNFESEKILSPINNEVTITIHNFISDIPVPEKYLLIPIMKGYWKLTPAGENKVHVMMQMFTEPGGIIPAWLANMVVVDSPYVTLKGLRERINLKHQVK
jgi:hypothetical protein